MRAGIHPQYGPIQVVCTNCKNHFTVNSVLKNDIDINSCPNCHPFITGKRGTLIDTTGCVERFTNKYGSLNLQRSE